MIMVGATEKLFWLPALPCLNFGAELGPGLVVGDNKSLRLFFWRRVVRCYVTLEQQRRHQCCQWNGYQFRAEQTFLACQRHDTSFLPFAQIASTHATEQRI